MTNKLYSVAYRVGDGPKRSTYVVAPSAISAIRALNNSETFSVTIYEIIFISDKVVV